MARKQGLAHRLYVGELSYDFIGRRKWWYILSAALIAISLLGLLVRGLDLGIEFKGGADFQVPVKVQTDTVETYRHTVAELNLPKMDDTQVLTVGDSKVRVQTRSLDVDEVAKVREALASQAGVHEDQVTYSLIGASWGKQITQKGVIALVVFLVLVMLLIWLYFREAKMALSAILALLHDLVVTVGIYALIGFKVTPATLIGVLTILGYSLYDTVVVFDKVRENTKDLTKGNRTFAQAANVALNQVLIRSFNTTLIGVLPVAALLFAGAFILGSGPLEDLGLALFIGMIVGAYSSVFLATPMLVDMKEREPATKAFEAKLAKREDRHTTRPEVKVAEVEPSNAEVAAERRAAAVPVAGRPVGVVDPERAQRAQRATASGASGRPQPHKQTRSERKK